MSNTRLTALLAVLVALLAALAYGGRDPETPVAAPDLAPLRAAAALAPCPPGVGRGLPAMELPCVGEPGTVQLSAVSRGRPMVVNVWATWCPPCVREVPLLQDFHRRAAGRVDLLGVVHQDTAENALRFAADPALGGMSYPSVMDDSGELLRRYSSGPPATLFVTADGRVAGSKRGEIKSRAELDGLVAKHLGVRL